MRRALLSVAIIVAVVLTSVALYVYISMSESEEERELQIVKKFQPRLIRKSPLLFRKEDFEYLSPWQKYVTPEDIEVKNVAGGLTNLKDAYKTAVHWLWVSDATLNGVQEKWLMPHEFLANTSNYPTNPAPGETASDCEEQAYTLVSVIRAMGIDAGNVRVVVGKVNFSGEIGGHAWVEIYENGKWFALEATSGPYWDDDDRKLHERRGYPFNYFKNHKYPSVEIWGYFNDIYYYNPITNKGNAPPHWHQGLLLSL
ncbi:MAG TPA: hypothetical protein ENF43_02745 [Thermoplasmatales archaeon]|nr:hypothetical protein [Thermoplasmatales archaeon]